MKRYPCILQRDETDCGPAVLASLVRYYKLSLSVARIRDIAGTDLEGTNLLGLSAAAEKVRPINQFRSVGIQLSALASPIQINWLRVRMYIRPLAIAGVASDISGNVLLARTLYSGPASSTITSPSRVTR